MNDWKKLVKCIFCPHPLLLALLIPIATVLLVFGLSERFSGTPLAYISYSVSAYTLVASVWRFPRFVRRVKRGFWNIPLIRKLNAHPLGHLFLNDITFRGTASIYQGFAVNTLYALLRGVTAYLYRSVWFAAIAVYYLLLGMVRMTLIVYVRRLGQHSNPDERLLSEFQGYRLCGFLMLLLNAGMSGMAVLMIRDNQHYSYPGYIIYLSALYTFYAAITATCNLFKFRKLKSPILSASKAIAFTGAMMSVLVLQTAMIARFGADDAAFRQTANTITGTFVCISSVIIAFFMIFRGSHCIGKLKNSSREETLS